MARLPPLPGARGSARGPRQHARVQGVVNPVQQLSTTVSMALPLDPERARF